MIKHKDIAILLPN